jgi:DNA primase
MASIEEVKNQIKDTPISSVINFYYPITKRGANYEAVCPFHSDTKPSLKINDSKGVYKCFACGAAGDSIKFVQDYKSLDFIEAIKDIASNLGMQVDEYQKKQANPKQEMGLKVLDRAYKYYKKVANESAPENFTSFLKKRNLNQESVDNFGLGYAPGNNAFTAYLNSIPNKKDRDFAIKVAKEIGIIRDSYKGPGQYDFFRDRVVFPIWDHSGNVRGFSSRAVLDHQKPKYLNSGESFIFDKGNILYGFNIAKNNIRQKDSVIVVEGNMDVVVLHQYGFNNSVGTMGVAFSENSARLLTNMTTNIYLAMDSDDAGMKGMERSNKILLEKKILAKYISFAPMKDPDDFLNEYGRLELDKRIKEAPTFVDFKISQIIPDPVPTATDRKLDILKEVFELLSPLGNELVAKEFAIKASKSLGLRSSEDDITKAYTQYLEDQEQLKSRYKKQPEAKKALPTPPQPEGPPMPEYQEGPPADMMDQIAGFENNAFVEAEPMEVNAPTKMEKKLVEELISHPECLESNQITEILDFIRHSEVKQLVQWLKEIYLEIDDSDYESFIKTKLEQPMNAEIKNVIASGLFNNNKLKLNNNVVEKMLKDYKTRLHNEQLIKRKEDLINRQKNAVTEEESIQLMEEIQKVGKEMLDLKINKS